MLFSNPWQPVWPQPPSDANYSSSLANYYASLLQNQRPPGSAPYTPPTPAPQPPMPQFPQPYQSAPVVSKTPLPAIPVPQALAYQQPTFSPPQQQSHQSPRMNWLGRLHMARF